jgi:hypothetical protein
MNQQEKMMKYHECEAAYLKRQAAWLEFLDDKAALC